MKKQLFSVILILAVINAYSQPEHKLKFGIRMGLAFANTKLDYYNVDTRVKMKTGFMTGGFVNFSLSKNIVFQPELLYVSKGGNEFTENGYSIPFSFDYLEVPLNILYQSTGGSGTYFLGGGLSPALHLNRAYDGNEIKDIDLGINFLAGYKIPIGFSFNLAYTYGLINATDNKEFIKTIRNRYFSITAGYEF